ncbi:MAG: hypothetical protein IPM96_18285 [Ignavibacteria bacterium]|nr:hypothetical protein [Ignavibacteria bacterium]
MKRSILFLAAVIISAIALSNIQGVEKNSDLNEIKNIIQYSPNTDWTVTAYIGTTPYGYCGPTHSGGACSITGLSAGTYTLIAERYGCTAIMYNVYHPGSGITTVYFGPSSPEINCAR